MSDNKSKQTQKYFFIDGKTKSISSYLKALKNYERSGDKEKIIQSYFDIGTKYGSQHNYRKALEYFFLTFNATSENDNPKIHVKSAANIGLLYTAINKNEKAIEFLLYAQKFFKLKSDKINVANTNRHIADSYNNAKIYTKALEYYFKAIDIYESLEDNILMSKAINGTAVTYYYLGNYDAALERFFKSLKIQKDEKFFDGIGITENNDVQGELHLDMQNNIDTNSLGDYSVEYLAKDKRTAILSLGAMGLFMSMIFVLV